MKETVLFIASFFGATGIILGAFAAHGLKKVMTSEKLAAFETGVKYQMYHALALLIIGFQLPFASSLEKGIAYCFIIGTVLFSGSIYGLSIASIKNKKVSFLGPITPIGGLIMLMGWILLGYLFSS